MMIERPLYTTIYGEAYLGDSLQLLDQLGADSNDLVITSPPFALQSEKVYGNVIQVIYYSICAEHSTQVICMKRPAVSVHLHRCSMVQVSELHQLGVSQLMLGLLELMIK